MSRIGNKGFTLIEVMVAVAILSSGIVLIYQSFFKILDTFNYYDNYLKASCFANDKIWEAQKDLSQYGELAFLERNGVYVIGKKSFKWTLDYSAIGEEPPFYRIDLNLSLKRGQKTIGLSRNAYALYKEKR